MNKSRKFEDFFTFIRKMSSFPVFFWRTFEVQPACLVLIWITFEHATCKRICVVFPVCSQPVLLGVEFDGAPRFYIHDLFFPFFLVSYYFFAVGENLLQDWEPHTPEIVSMEITPSVESSGKAWCQSRRPGRFLRTNTRRENQLRYIYGIPFHAILLLNFFDYLFPAISFSYLQEILFYYYFEKDVCDL